MEASSINHDDDDDDDDLSRHVTVRKEFYVTKDMTGNSWIYDDDDYI